MGAGKSAVGKRLARSSGVAFYDTDAVVEELARRSVAELFTIDGEAHFRTLEHAAVVHLAGVAAVVATGGGVVNKQENVNLMQATGPVVWLRASLATLVSRVGNGRHRPLLSGEPVEDRLKAILDQRMALYEKASTQIIDTDGLDVGDVIAQIETPW